MHTCTYQKEVCIMETKINFTCLILILAHYGQVCPRTGPSQTKGALTFLSQFWVLNLASKENTKEMGTRKRTVFMFFP